MTFPIQALAGNLDGRKAKLNKTHITSPRKGHLVNLEKFIRDGWFKELEEDETMLSQVMIGRSYLVHSVDDLYKDDQSIQTCPDELEEAREKKTLCGIQPSGSSFR